VEYGRTNPVAKTVDAYLVALGSSKEELEEFAAEPNASNLHPA
jgi:hypothetical protein